MGERAQYTGHAGRLGAEAATKRREADMAEADPLDDVELILMETSQDVADFFTWLGERRPVLGADTETGEGPGVTHKDGALWWWSGNLRLVQFGDAHTGWVIPWEWWAGVAREVFERYDSSPIAFHNAPFDVHWLERAGINIPRHRLEDTLVMHHLVGPPAPHGLKPVATKLISPKADYGKQALDEGMAKQGWTWGTVPVAFEPYWLYSALDGILAARLYEHLAPQIQGAHATLYELEMANRWASVDMETPGLLIDREYAEATYQALVARVRILREEGERVWGLSLGSNDAVISRLQADGLVFTKLTDGGNLSLDKEVLGGLVGKHPLADLVYEYKRAVKFSVAYFKGTLDRLEGNYVHASINTLGARTGRYSVSKPPFQQLPSGDVQVRRMVVPEPGGYLLSVDYSNIEVRLLAHLSQEPKMLQAFRDGEDIHLAMARAMYGEDAGPPERKKSKSGTLGRQYGIGAGKFAVQQGVTEDEAREFLRFYDESFPGIPEFIQAVEEMAEERFQSEGVAYITTPAGRFQPLMRSEARDRRYYALVNFACQGWAADLMKQAIARLHQSEIGEFMRMPVHDEILFSIPEGVDPREVGAIARETMEEPDMLDVPLTCDVEYYKESWADGVKYTDPFDDE